MAVLNPVLQTDSFDVWRIKTNLGFNELNNIGITSIISIIDPLNDQDILVYNATDQVFENTSSAGFITEVIHQYNIHQSSSKGKQFYFGSLRSIF